MKEDSRYAQENMEKSLRDLCRQITDGVPETINAYMKPTFAACCAAEKSCTIAYDIETWMRNPMGMFHGGLMATAMDIAMGVNTFYWCGGKLTPTISMQVNFVRPVPVGTRLMIRSEVVSAGRTIEYATAEAWVEGAEQKIVATATGVYHVVPLK